MTGRRRERWGWSAEGGSWVGEAHLPPPGGANRDGDGGGGSDGDGDGGNDGDNSDGAVNFDCVVLNCVATKNDNLSGRAQLWWTGVAYNKGEIRSQLHDMFAAHLYHNNNITF